MFKNIMFCVIGGISSIASVFGSCIAIAYITATLFAFFYHIAIAVSNNAYGSMSGIAPIGIELGMNLIGCAVVSLITLCFMGITIKCYEKGEKGKEKVNASQGVSSEGNGLVGEVLEGVSKS